MLRVHYIYDIIRVKYKAAVRYSVCCIALCCHPIYSGRQTCGRTSRGYTGGRLHRISPPSFCGACLNFYREKDLAIPFLRRP